MDPTASNCGPCWSAGPHTGPMTDSGVTARPRVSTSAVRIASTAVVAASAVAVVMMVMAVASAVILAQALSGLSFEWWRAESGLGDDVADPSPVGPLVLGVIFCAVVGLGVGAWFLRARSGDEVRPTVTGPWPAAGWIASHVLLCSAGGVLLLQCILHAIGAAAWSGQREILSRSLYSYDGSVAVPVFSSFGLALPALIVVAVVVVTVVRDRVARPAGGWVIVLGAAVPATIVLAVGMALLGL